MDDRLEKALEHANYKSTIELQRKNLELQLENALLFSVGGGTFIVSRELMNFVELLINKDQPNAVLIDNKNKPILIEDLKKFSEDLMSVYFEATNQFHAEYEKLRKARSVKMAVGL